MRQETTSAFRQWIGFALLVSAVVTPTFAQRDVDPQKLLAEADRLAWLRVWTRAEPFYAKAREAFLATGDERNALYAEVSRLRGQLPTLAARGVRRDKPAWSRE